MKNSFALVQLLVTLFLLTSCAQSMSWDYSAFTKNPMPLYQAQAICSGYAENSSAGISAERAPDQFHCTTDYIGSYATTDCQNNNGLAQLSNNIRANELRGQTENNYYRSCMAEKGWDAKLVPAVSDKRIMCTLLDGTRVVCPEMGS